MRKIEKKLILETFEVLILIILMLDLRQMLLLIQFDLHEEM